MNVPMMDTAPDLGLKVAANKLLLAGTIEGKNRPKTKAEFKRMFGSDTDVAGEVFEQLFLSKANLGDVESIGMRH
jgi:hypothetical protein